MRVVLLVTAVLVFSGTITVLSRLRSGENRTAPTGLAPVVAVPVAPSNQFEAESLEFERKLVKGVPFSATLMVETFPETGEPRTSTFSIHRDAEGRTRRDQMPQTSTINDPVAGFTYLLQHRDNTFTKTTLRSHTEESSDDVVAAMRNSITNGKRGASYQMLPLRENGSLRKDSQPNNPSAAAANTTKRESLGQREIEGVTAEGTSVSVTVPPGALGNDRPMKIVNEHWYSPDLKAVVLIERVDPRTGRSVYRLTGIKRTDPAASLFTVPSDYKVLVE